MRFANRPCLALLTILASCGGNQTPEAGTAPGISAAAREAYGSGAAAAEDYFIVERHSFLDEQRFDQPVEAFSMLFPKGWKIEGGVKWRGIGECRGDIVSNQVRASSPDGVIQYQVMPSRSFNWADDATMLQSIRAGAQAGGGEASRPFDAGQYIQQYARQALDATASEIRPDESQAEMIRQLDEQANAAARQYGTGMQQTTTMSFGKLAFAGGDEGILHTGVTNLVTRKPNLLTGGFDTFSTTSAFYNVMMRFPPARRGEAVKLFGMLQASFRQNPIWKDAKDRFLTQLGNAGHAARMETIRLMGEQARAYARAASQAADRRMRDWESQQASQDRQHRAFVQTIREVETWRDSSGAVELSSGYGQAWSRGDGVYVLTNNPNFDPNRAFQEQRWEEMKRIQP